MRCLNCRLDGIPISTEICPRCGVHLPTLFQNVLPPGTLLRGTYRIDYALGRGGFGITYRGMHTALEQQVAIKEFYPQEHALREGTTGRLLVPTTKREGYQRGLGRFLREGQTLAKLNHPHVVRVRDFFEERGTAYLVMELIAGKNFKDELESQPGKRLPTQRVKTVMTALVDALTLVHQQGIYHLDLKPDNVMITSEGRIVLVDFGASRQYLGTTTSTHQSTRAYTLEYTAPEVIAGRAVGATSDLFELGMMLHEMLTGKLPPPALERLLQDDFIPQGLDEPWQTLVTAALHIKPEYRPQTVQAWWETLLQFEAEQEQRRREAQERARREFEEQRQREKEPQPQEAETARSKRQRKKVLIGLGLGLGTAIVTFVGIFIPQFWRPVKNLIPSQIVNTPVNFVLQPQLDYCDSFSEGLAAVRIGTKVGFIDKSGNLVIQPQFDYASSFSEGLASVTIDKKNGFVDKNGNLVIQPQFDSASSFSEGLAEVKIGNKYGFTDKNGHLVIQPQLDYASSFSEGLASVTIDKKNGFIDKSGNLVIQPQFNSASSFSERLAAVKIGDKYGFIDKSGNLVIQAQFNFILLFFPPSFSEGLAGVRIDKKYGFIDKSGNWVIQPQFDSASSFSEGLAAVKIGDKYGFIDKSGNLIIQPQFDDYSSFSFLFFPPRFSEGLAAVKIGKKYGFIDKNGHLVIQPQFDEVSSFSEGLAAVKNGEKWGYIRNPLK